MVASENTIFCDFGVLDKPRPNRPPRQKNLHSFFFIRTFKGVYKSATRASQGRWGS